MSKINETSIKKVLDSMLDTFKKKNADYGNSFEQSLDVFGPISAVTRMNDKMERLKSLMKKEKVEVQDESFKDTVLDLANYATMLYTYLDSDSKPHDVSISKYSVSIRLGDDCLFIDETDSLLKALQLIDETCHPFEYNRGMQDFMIESQFTKRGPYLIVTNPDFGAAFEIVKKEY